MESHLLCVVSSVSPVLLQVCACTPIPETQPLLETKLRVSDSVRGSIALPVITGEEMTYKKHDCCSRLSQDTSAPASPHPDFPGHVVPNCSAFLGLWPKSACLWASAVGDGDSRCRNLPFIHRLSCFRHFITFPSVSLVLFPWD